MWCTPPPHTHTHPPPPTCTPRTRAHGLLCCGWCHAGWMDSAASCSSQWPHGGGACAAGCGCRQGRQDQCESRRSALRCRGTPHMRCMPATHPHPPGHTCNMRMHGHVVAWPPWSGGVSAPGLGCMGRHTFEHIKCWPMCMSWGSRGAAALLVPWGPASGASERTWQHGAWQPVTVH